MAQKKKKKRKGSKRSSAKRSAAKRTNPSVTRKRKTRRGSRKRTNPATGVSRRTRRRRRKNPSISFMQIGTWALGGLGAYGAVWGAKKLAASIDSAYAQVGVQLAAPLVVAVPAMLLGAENAAAGAFGAFFFQAPTLIMQGYNIYKAQQPPTANPGTKGLRGLPMGVDHLTGLPATARVGLRTAA